MALPGVASQPTAHMGVPYGAHVPLYYQQSFVPTYLFNNGMRPVAPAAAVSDTSQPTLLYCIDASSFVWYRCVSPDFGASSWQNLCGAPPNTACITGLPNCEYLFALRRDGAIFFYYRHAWRMCGNAQGSWYENWQGDQGYSENGVSAFSLLDRGHLAIARGGRLYVARIQRTRIADDPLQVSSWLEAGMAFRVHSIAAIGDLLFGVHSEFIYARNYRRIRSHVKRELKRRADASAGGSPSGPRSAGADFVEFDSWRCVGRAARVTCIASDGTDLHGLCDSKIWKRPGVSATESECQWTFECDAFAVKCITSGPRWSSPAFLAIATSLQTPLQTLPAPPNYPHLPCSSEPPMQVSMAAGPNVMRANPSYLATYAPAFAAPALAVAEPMPISCPVLPAYDQSHSAEVPLLSGGSPNVRPGKRPCRRPAEDPTTGADAADASASNGAAGAAVFPDNAEPGNRSSHDTKEHHSEHGAAATYCAKRQPPYTVPVRVPKSAIIETDDVDIAQVRNLYRNTDAGRLLFFSRSGRLLMRKSLSLETAANSSLSTASMWLTLPGMLYGAKWTAYSGNILFAIARQKLYAYNLGALLESSDDRGTGGWCLLSGVLPNGATNLTALGNRLYIVLRKQLWSCPVPVPRRAGDHSKHWSCSASWVRIGPAPPSPIGAMFSLGPRLYAVHHSRLMLFRRLLLDGPTSGPTRNGVDRFSWADVGSAEYVQRIAVSGGVLYALRRDFLCTLRRRLADEHGGLASANDAPPPSRNAGCHACHAAASGTSGNVGQCGGHTDVWPTVRPAYHWVVICRVQNIISLVGLPARAANVSEHFRGLDDHWIPWAQDTERQTAAPYQDMLLHAVAVAQQSQLHRLQHARGPFARRRTLSEPPPAPSGAHLVRLRLQPDDRDYGFRLGIEDGCGPCGSKVGFVVRQVVPDGVADRSGRMHAGDEIVAVSGCDVAHLSLEQLRDRIVQCTQPLHLLLRPRRRGSDERRSRCAGTDASVPPAVPSARIVAQAAGLLV